MTSPSISSSVLSAAVAGIVVAVGCLLFYAENLRTGTPITYDGDAPAVMARVMAYAQGETHPMVPMVVSRLNAPFQATWSDFPSEDLPFYLPGLLVRAFGLAHGTTIFVILQHAMAGVAFVLAAMLLGSNRLVSIGLGVLYGLAPYGFQRGLNHLNLTAYGLLPMLVMVVLMLWQHGPHVQVRFRWAVCTGVALLAGLGNPYYIAWFLGFLVILLWAQIMQRSWSVVWLTGATVAATMLGFLIQNLDTFVFVAQHGKNLEAVSRNYWGLVQFGLTIPDLVFPSAHRWDFFQEKSREWYHLQVPVSLLGESQTAYIGLIGLLSVGWLGFESVIRIATHRAADVSRYFWLLVGVLGFALVGGVNYLLGGFGFILLRATNRFSIVILAIGLLFLAKKLSSIKSPPLRITAILAIVGVGVWDQIPEWPTWEQSRRETGAADFVRDRAFFKSLESTLPAESMVFQLPVKGYPETHVIHLMGDYEHFRPYLHTDAMRFSYGTIRGRGDSDWQAQVAQRPATDMVSALEKFGFSAILINRRAYEDDATELINQLTATGITPLSENADFVAFRLNPSSTPALPDMAEPFQLVGADGFYPIEQDATSRWLWAENQATLRILPNYVPDAWKGRLPEFRVTFTVQSARPDSEITMQSGDAPPEVILQKGQRSVRIEKNLPPTGIELHFITTGDPITSELDPRQLSFRIINPEIAPSMVTPND